MYDDHAWYHYGHHRSTFHFLIGASFLSEALFFIGVMKQYYGFN